MHYSDLTMVKGCKAGLSFYKMPGKAKAKKKKKSGQTEVALYEIYKWMFEYYLKYLSLRQFKIQWHSTFIDKTTEL